MLDQRDDLPRELRPLVFHRIPERFQVAQLLLLKRPLKGLAQRRRRDHLAARPLILFTGRALHGLRFVFGQDLALSLQQQYRRPGHVQRRRLCGAGG